MYGGRYLLFFSLALVLLLLPSCGIGFSADDVQGAIEDGIIVPPGGVTLARDTNVELVVAERTNIIRTASYPVRPHFPVVYHVRFSYDGGIYDGAYITQAGTTVQKGDFLGSQTFRFEPTLESDTRAVNRRRLLYQIADFENAFREERAARNLEISNLRETIAQEDYTTLYQLQLERLLLQLERFLFDSSQTRQNFERALDNLRGEPQAESIYAPIDGVLTHISTIPAGRLVHAHTVFFSIADERFIQFIVRALFDELIFGTVHTISEVDGAFEFKAKVVNDPFAADRPGFGQATNFTLVPYDMEAFTAAVAEYGFTMFDVVNMDLTITIEVTLAYDAITIPNRAIRPEDLAEYVLIYNEGRHAKRYITRGIQEMGNVQILSGLSEGQKVVLP